MHSWVWSQVQQTLTFSPSAVSATMFFLHNKILWGVTLWSMTLVPKYDRKLRYGQVVVLPPTIQHCDKYSGSSSSRAPGPAPSSGWTSLLVTNCMWKEICRAHWTLVLLLFLCHVPAEMKWDRFLFFSLLPLFTALWPPVCWINDQRCSHRHSSLLFFFSPSSPSPLPTRLQISGTWNEAGKKRCTFIPAAVLWPSSPSTFFYSLNVANMDLCQTFYTTE